MPTFKTSFFKALSGINNAAADVEGWRKVGEDKLDCYMVKVIESRRISNEIVRSTGLAHKSPQILLIDKQQIVWNTSHWKITEHRIRKAVRKLS
ncbi:monothiol bacilliredoxin BrxC family protein [Aquisalibacillus elongatus]|uniref:monothiol bacilliredoxin BrxC family protein n=1 Tax=Aquisalibacillus elongatus TaxID=485577 RepID=UPI000F52078F|nr:monothiol bacilliredoxin BrxC family protein [Aquisalibacillus elongatus]